MDAELDRKIAEQVMGWTVTKYGFWADTMFMPKEPPADWACEGAENWEPTENWAHFGLVLGRVTESMQHLGLSFINEEYDKRAWCNWRAGYTGIMRNGHTVLEAACRAILEAWGGR